MSKLNNILLVDDDDIVNTINSTIVRHASFAENITVETSVDGAISVLKNQNGNGDLPELIFLDVNMPEKNGWDFINEYKQLPFGDARPKIIMVSSSINPNDEEQALKNDMVLGFISKPISKEILDKIYQDHFSN
ncbi:MAG: response regulator [Bacteroidota bacterium]